MSYIYQPLLTPQTRTPTVTLVGGAGNTVPQYTTIQSRWMKIGPNLVRESFYLTGDGGNEGAGSGTLNLSLNFTSSANQQDQPIVFGYAHNNVTEYLLYGIIGPASSTVQLSYMSVVGTRVNFTGAEQNNTNRFLRGVIEYEI